MKKLKENQNSVVMCIFEMVVGILLLINPVGFTSGIIVAAGIVMLALGVKSAVGYFRTETAEAKKGQQLTKGLLGIIAGLFCTFKSHWFIATFPVLTILYGVAMLFAGIAKIQWVVDGIRSKSNGIALSVLSTIVTIGCAAVIITSPFTTTAALWMFTGITLVIEAIFDIVSLVTE